MTPYPWQLSVWSRVSGAIREQRLAHALLIAGPDGAGKRHFAACIAAALWCRQVMPDGTGCGRCPDCLQVASGAHSGYFTVRVEDGKRDISIEQVRELSERLSITQHDGRAKVAIIEPADALNVNGVNALLKTIEEPTPGSHLLLVSSRPQALAATLRSRCQRLRIAVPARTVARDWLQARSDGAIDDARVDLALDHAHGAPLRAAELLDGDGLALREDWARTLHELAAGRGDISASAERIGKEHGAVWVQWLYGWLHRLLRTQLPAGGDDPALVDLLARLPVELLDRYIGEVQQALSIVQGPADRRLLVESLLIGWLGLLARAGRLAQTSRS